METTFLRNQINVLESRLRADAKRIQVLFGPRQVGKSTLARQMIQRLGWPHCTASADAVGTAQSSWILDQWQQARILAERSPDTPCILVLDEVQKIPDWSEYVKKLWDEDKAKASTLRVVILGSSPLLMQKGLTESLAGRFEMIRVTHWSYQEMHKAFGFSLDQYIYYGGYPGAADLVTDPQRWSTFVLDSLVETTLSRDIFLMARIDKPALFRQLFELGCLASGQILSLQKIMGQLQDAGNATTLAGYLRLMEGAGLLAGISKFSGSHIRRKASSPKFQVFNNALLTAWQGRGLELARQDPDYWGRLVESCVGGHLLNATKTMPLQLSYWNEGDREVDFVLENQGKILALEVKSGRRGMKPSAMEAFLTQNRGAQVLSVGTGGIPLADFLSMSPLDLFSQG